jgi:hypothetical protein
MTNFKLNMPSLQPKPESRILINTSLENKDSSDRSSEIDDFKTGPELKMNIFNLKRVQEVND